MKRLRRLTTVLLLLLLSCLFSKALAADRQYTYYVINLSGEIATQAKATQAEGSAPEIPDVIKSKLINGTAGEYRYYNVDQFNVANNIYTLKASPTVLSVLPSENTNIYVKYTYDNSKSAIDLSGNTFYYFKDEKPGDPTKVHYMTYNKKYQSADWRFDGSTNGDDNFGDDDRERQWFYEGEDPYKIYIGNVYVRDVLKKDAYLLRSDLPKGKFEDNNNVRYGAKTVNNLFNTYFFDSDGHIVAANNVYQWNSNTNKYIYYSKENADNYEDIGGRFLTTGTARLNLSKMGNSASVITEVTIHMVNQTEGKETYSFNTVVSVDNPKPSATVMSRLERLGCTLGATYYKELALTNAIAAPITNDVTDIYIPYTVHAATLSDTYNITFSTEENPVWFSLKISVSGGRLFFYDRGRNVIDSSSNENADKPATDTRAQFAFVGDPYSFRIICKDLDGQYAFQDSTVASGFQQKSRQRTLQ